MKKFLALGAVLVLTGCPTDDGETGETGDTDTIDTDDTDVATPFDPATDLVVAWSAQSVTVTLTNTDSTGFFLGMAETASGTAGWYGEDCLVNDCHSIADGLTLTLNSVDTIGAVVPGSTTLFDNDADGTGDATTSDGSHRLTYILQVVGGTDPGDGTCYVWGDDPTYYATEGCTTL